MGVVVLSVGRGWIVGVVALSVGRGWIVGVLVVNTWHEPGNKYTGSTSLHQLARNPQIL